MHEVVEAAVEVAGRQGKRCVAVAQLGKPKPGIVTDQPPLKIREPWPLIQARLPGVGVEPPPRDPVLDDIPSLRKFWKLLEAGSRRGPRRRQRA